jgi:hypothetical protein
MVDGMTVFNQPFMQNNEILNMITSVFQKLATDDLSKSARNWLQSILSAKNWLQTILVSLPETGYRQS